tara:strand:- start:68 stop:652 length:585 start_codon:yes stop_codon:yes gene_type:complete
MAISESYIREYPNAFSKDFCENVIERFETMNRNNQTSAYDGSVRYNQDTRVVYDWAPHYNMFYHDPELCIKFYETVNKYYNEQYCKEFSVLKDSVVKHTPKGMSVQRNGPKEAYHIWHVENNDKASGDRVSVYMLYLNTVKEGGETEFLYQGIKTKPTAGKLVFFPATWQHPHRGNPIYEGYKYIITGWFTNDE